MLIIFVTGGRICVHGVIARVLSVVEVGFRELRLDLRTAVSPSFGRG